VNKGLWAVAGVALLGTASAVAVYVASPGGEEEAVQATVSATAGTETPTPAGSPTVSPAASSTPDEVPADWQTYNDLVLAFSLRYPPDLVFKDVTPGGATERAVDFRSPTDSSRALGISVSKKPEGLTLKEWAVEFAACRPTSIESATLAGAEAMGCTREVIEGQPEPSILAERGGKVFLMSAIGLTDAEFTQVLSSFLF
jgi:hypothetical protein